MLPKPLKARQHSRCLVIKHGKKAQQERSEHVSLPRVYCHKQVMLPNYSMTCCPALLCQSQAQDWSPPPAFEQECRDQSTMSHPSFPVHTQLRVYSLSAVSSTTAGLVHPYLVKDLTPFRKQISFMLCRTPADQHIQRKHLWNQSLL